MRASTTLKACLLLLSLELTGWPCATAHAQGLFDFEREPIDYHKKSAVNPIARLQEKILHPQGPRYGTPGCDP